MRLLLILSAVLLAAIARAQNVGIGKSNPTEKLDVSGNVNIDGRLKLNGSAGQPGQTLMVQPDGSQQWINTFGYKNRKSILPGTSFIVPAGVTELFIELIAGGGGGAKGGGGGAGGYIIAKVKVAPGTSITTTTDSQSGSPSSTENEFGMSGAMITVFGPGFNLGSFGGFGATSSRPGTGSSGLAEGDSLMFNMIFTGAAGTPLIETYGQRSATEFVTMRKQGDGGICAYNPLLIARGGFFSFNTQTLLNITLISGHLILDGYGYGGAGGNIVNGSFSFWGGNGGAARIFISY